MYNQVINEDAYHICKNEKRKIISLTSLKSKYIGINKDEKVLSVLDLDRSDFKDERADYIIENEKIELILLELKGADVSKAIDQLERTIKLISDDYLKSLKLNLRIVTSKTPSPNYIDNKRKALDIKIKRINKINNLIIKSQLLEEII